MPLSHYFHNVEDRVPARYATVYTRGALVNGAHTGVNTVAVHAGHEIATGDNFVAFVDGKTPLSDRVYTASTAASTSIVFANEVQSFPNRCILVGLGTDSGSLASDVAFDGSSLTVYKDPAGSASWTSANVDIQPSGEFSFYGSGRPVWVLIRNAYNKPTRVYIDVAPYGPVAAGGTALPAAGVPRQLFVLEQGAGLPDILYCWVKQASDAYAWVEVISAP